MWGQPPPPAGAPAYPAPVIYQQGPPAYATPGGFGAPGYGAPGAYPAPYGAPAPPYGQPAYPGAPPPPAGGSAYPGAPPAPGGGSPYPGGPPAPTGAGQYPGAPAAAPAAAGQYPGAAPPAPSGAGQYPGISTGDTPAVFGAASQQRPAAAAAAAPATAPPAASAPSYTGAPPAAHGAPSMSGPPPAAYGAPSMSGAPPPAAYGAPSMSGPPPAAHSAPSMSGPPVPAPMPPPAGPPKRAVLVGCMYPRSNAQLNGCINDIQCMKHLLLTRFGFTEANIVMLRDDTYHPDFYPTRSNIYRSIQWLMQGQAPGASLFFHFSGHGSQKPDYTGDEDDGMDETILPTDYKQAGQIVDDELHQLLVRPLLPGVTLHAVVDACHSGTVLDLPYRTKFKPHQGMVWKGRPRPGSATSGGTALQFGACRDSQVAQDTNKMSGNVHTGAATFSFIQAVERGGTHQSYAQVLAAMSVALEPHGPTPSSTGILGMLLGMPTSMGQTPVLSCDKPLDLNTRLML